MDQRDYGTGPIGALFADQEQAFRAIEELRSAGFTDSQIGLVTRHVDGEMPEDQGPGAAEGAMQGAIGGGVLGGIVGALLGATVLAIPGVGPLLAAGIFIPAVTGAGVGAVGGGLAGTLVGMGHSEYDAKRLNEGMEAGNVLVTVHASDRADEARQILLRNGADLGTEASSEAMSLDDPANHADVF